VSSSCTRTHCADAVAKARRNVMAGLALAAGMISHKEIETMTEIASTFPRLNEPAPDTFWSMGCELRADSQCRMGLVF